jgi:hypothetical protein
VSRWAWLSDQLLQGPDRCRRPEPGQVGVEVGLELVEQDLVLGVAELPSGGDLGGIDQHRPEARHLPERRLHQPVDGIVEAEELAPHADPGPAQPVRIQEARVVGGGPSLPLPGDGIPGSTPTRAPSSVAASATVRAIGPAVSWGVRDRDDAGSADQAHGGLDADDPVGRGGADDGTVGLGAGGASVGALAGPAASEPTVPSAAAPPMALRRKPRRPMSVVRLVSVMVCLRCFVCNLLGWVAQAAPSRPHPAGAGL